MDSVLPLGSEYQREVRRAFQDGWIDVYENAGKRSGASSRLCRIPIRTCCFQIATRRSMRCSRWGTRDGSSDAHMAALRTGHSLSFTRLHDLCRRGALNTEPGACFSTSCWSGTLASGTGRSSSSTPSTLCRHVLCPGAVCDAATAHRLVEHDGPSTAETSDACTRVCCMNTTATCWIGKKSAGRVVAYPSLLQFTVLRVWYATAYAFAPRPMQTSVLGLPSAGRLQYIAVLQARSIDYPMNLLARAGASLSRPERCRPWWPRIVVLVGQLERNCGRAMGPTPLAMRSQPFRLKPDATYIAARPLDDARQTLQDPFPSPACSDTRFDHIGFHDPLAMARPRPAPPDSTVRILSTRWNRSNTEAVPVADAVAGVADLRRASFRPATPRCFIAAVTVVLNGIGHQVGSGVRESVAVTNHDRRVGRFDGCVFCSARALRLPRIAHDGRDARRCSAAAPHPPAPTRTRSPTRRIGRRRAGRSRGSGGTGLRYAAASAHSISAEWWRAGARLVSSVGGQPALVFDRLVEAIDAWFRASATCSSSFSVRSTTMRRWDPRRPSHPPPR